MLEKRHEVVNPKAPVRAWDGAKMWTVAMALGKKLRLEDESRDFKNLEEFEKWYRSGWHGELRIRGAFLVTDILLDRIDDAPKGGAATPRMASLGSKRSRVSVDGTEYGSVYKAFAALGLSIPAHTGFRAELKKAGEKVYSESGNNYNFKVVS